MSLVSKYLRVETLKTNISCCAKDESTGKNSTALTAMPSLGFHTLAISIIPLKTKLSTRYGKVLGPSEENIFIKQ